MVHRIRAAAYRALVPPLRTTNGAARRVVAATHLLQYKVEGALQPHAEWFDHELDAYWRWPRRGSVLFLERGILNRLVISPGAAVLELCCGDGFATQRFYAHTAGSVVAVDHNGAALDHARRWHPAPNIRYEQCDITQGLPVGPFDNVVWDSAMHHFTTEEIEHVVAGARDRLVTRGVLSGYTEIEDSAYEYTRSRFRSAQDIVNLLAQFAHAAVLELPGEGRRNLYYFASDRLEAIPLGNDDPRVTYGRRNPER